MMKTSGAIVFLGLLLAGCSSTQQDAPCEAATLVLHNTTIYTSNDKQWTASAVAINADRIVYVGGNEGARAYQCGAAEVLDLNGMTVYAGFTDGHQHLEGVGRRTKTLSLFGIPTLKETVAAIESWADEIEPGQWVLGRGWIEREWRDQQRFLTRHDVDAFTQDKPLYMPRADGVSALVNTAALKLAGVTKETPDPPGGRFVREPDGTPNGYVLAKAMDVFRGLIPNDSDEYLRDSLTRGMAVNAAMGWTQTQDAGMPYREVDIMKSIHEAGEMAHRVYVAVPVSEAAQMFARGRETTADGYLDVRGIKVFIDGTLGSRGAALLQNYHDADHNGFMNRTSKDELMPILADALRQGVQIETHVIGDRAVRSVLDWYAEAQAALPESEWQSNDLRWRLEHAQVITPIDQARLKDMAVIPSMQPSHGIGDLNFAPMRLGPERLAYAYPWQQLIDRGLKIIAGSDAPVEVGDPRIEFYAAVARKRLDGTSGPGWHPELAVSRETALKMLTIWPAYGAFQETERGSIEVGKLADFTIFDRDLMTIPEAEILSAQNMLTIVGGKVTYQRPAQN